MMRQHFCNPHWSGLTRERIAWCWAVQLCWFENEKTMRSSVKISYQVFSPSTEGNVSEDQHKVTTKTISPSARVTFGKIINHEDTLSPRLIRWERPVIFYFYPSSVPTRMQTAKDVVTTNSTKQVNVTVYNPRLSRSEAVEGLGIWIFKSYQLEVVSESLQRYHYITFDTKHISLLQLFSRFSISWNMLLYEKDPITFKWKNISVHICFQS